MSERKKEVREEREAIVGIEVRASTYSYIDCVGDSESQ